MKIRSAGLPDIETLITLNSFVQSLHASAIPLLFKDKPAAADIATAFQKMLSDPSAIWLLAEDEQPLGYLYAQFHEREENWFRPATRICNISHIVVSPHARRKGVAKNLIAALAQEANQRGFTRIELDVWSFNHEARAAFIKLGFHVFNERMELRR